MSDIDVARANAQNAPRARTTWRWARRFAPLLALPLLAVAISTVSADELFKLRVASVSVPPSMHTLYMQVADEEGIYKRNGLAVDGIVQLNSGPIVTQSLSSGAIDVADTDAEGVLNAAAAGFPLVAVAAPAQRLSYLVMVQPDIKSYKDLVGQPFAISRPGALSQYLMFPALDREGVTRNAVSWVPIGGPSQRRLALVNDRVKGALLHLDYALAAQRDGKVAALDQVLRTNPDYPHEVLVVRREVIEKHPAAVTAVVRSIIEACRFIVTHRERTIELYKKYTGETDTALANAAYDALLKMHGYGVNGGMTRKGLEDVTRLAAENGAKAIPVEGWADLRFQEEAIRQIGTIPE
jgi:ABC-type nitrate/sulfonate/bicarbonate transport system substrate-binding protein